MNTSEFWQSSSARTFSNTSYLPALPGQAPEKSIAWDAPDLKDELSIVEDLAKQEYGADSLEAEFYSDIAKQKYNIVMFLLGTHAVNLSIEASTLEERDTTKFKDDIKYFMPEIAKFSDKGFGEVSAERLSAIVARTRKSASLILESPERNKVVEESAERMLSVIPEVDPELVTAHYFLPEQSLIDYWKPLVEKKYADLLELIPNNQERFDCNDTLAIMNNVILVLKDKWGLANADKWKAKIGRATLLVDQDSEVIWVPENTDKNALTLRKNVVHEGGVHLLRKLLGELTGDPLVASDMPWRGLEEESLATLLDQIIAGKPREAGIVDYLSIGLTQNTLDQTNPVNLYELETFISDFETIRTEKPLTESLAKIARNRAFRIARNMPSIAIDGKLYQAPYAENLKYALGQPAANKFMIDNVGNPSALDDVMLGKFAYSKPKQSNYVMSKHKGLEELISRVPTAA